MTATHSSDAGYETIDLTVEDGIAQITLDREERLNVATMEMLSELVDAFDRIGDDDDARCVIVTGRGRAFCAGFDLGEGETSFARGGEAFRMPEVEAWRNQWLHTGDPFSVDKDGNYYYLDRKKDSIRRRGENICSMEIEKIVVGHDDVLKVAAVAVPDSVSEEEVKVVVVLKSGAKPDPRRYRVPRRAAPALHGPRYIEYADELPKTPTEKIRKRVLRERGVSDEIWDRTSDGVASPR